VDGSTFPLANFTIVIESELIRVSSRSSNVLTVVRGTEGTTAAAHASSLTVTHIISAAVLDNIQSSLNSYGDTIPTTGRLGSRHTYTDGEFSIHNGTSWVHYYKGHTVKRPLLSDFTQIVTSDGVLTQEGSSLVIKTSTTGYNATSMSFWAKAMVGTQVTMGHESELQNGNGAGPTLWMLDAANKAMGALCWHGDATGTVYIQRYNSPTSPASEGSYGVRMPAIGFARIRIISGTAYYDYSNVNKDFWSFYNDPLTTFIGTPTQWGFSLKCNSLSSGMISRVKLFHFDEV
jgi:hypothetical protein